MLKKENNPNQHVDWQMLLGDIGLKNMMKIKEVQISADAKAELHVA